MYIDICVASRYFRDLPEPLFTYDVYDDLIKLKGTKEDFDKYQVRAADRTRTHAHAPHTHAHAKC